MRKSFRWWALVIIAVFFGMSVAGSTASAAQNQRVLILPDAYTAGTDALVTALDAAGHDATLAQVFEFEWDGTNPPLTDFDAVIHLNGATFHTPLSVEAQLALVDFVAKGGNFIGCQFNGFEQHNEKQIDMPDLVLQLWPHPDDCKECEMTWEVVPGQEEHPVLKGIPESFTFFADSHDAGPLVEFPVDPSVVLMTSPAGGPAVTVREFGDGRVVNFSFGTNTSTSQTLQDAYIQQLYINAVSWESYTPEESIDFLVDDVRKLVEDGSLNPIQGFFLILRLRLAQRQLDNGYSRVAVFMLEKFSHRVEDLMENGTLETSEGQPLIDSVLGVIEDI